MLCHLYLLCNASNLQNKRTISRCLQQMLRIVYLFDSVIGQFNTASIKRFTVAGERELFDRFRHPVPSLDCVWDSPQILESLPLVLRDYATNQWTKSQKYYIQSLVRLQKLTQIKDTPVRDISVAEKDAMAHYSQHLLYLVHGQRKMIGEFAYQSEQLRNVRALLTDLIRNTVEPQEDQPPLPPQKKARDMHQLQCMLFARWAYSAPATGHFLFPLM